MPQVGQGAARPSYVAGSLIISTVKQEGQLKPNCCAEEAGSCREGGGRTGWAAISEPGWGEGGAAGRWCRAGGVSRLGGRRRASGRLLKAANRRPSIGAICRPDAAAMAANPAHGGVPIESLARWEPGTPSVSDRDGNPGRPGRTVETGSSGSFNTT